MNRLAPLRAAALALAAACIGTAAHATPFTVDAKANSSSGGVGVPTLSLTVGQQYNVNVALNDLWSAGALPRFSNADGLIRDLEAKVGDDSGVAAGTLIGQNMGFYSVQDDVPGGPFTDFFGALVGRIGSGNFFNVGVQYSGVATATGVLDLYYWDENNFDNTGSVIADVAFPAVPEPQAYALLLVGLAAVGVAARRRRG